MSKPKSKKNDQPRDVSIYWRERGYIAEIAARPALPGEDPTGEEAYQRAFHEAAQTSPPRLPNPSHYPNSASAREYLRKRSTEFLTIRGEKRQGEISSESGQISRKFRDPDQSPLFPGKKSTSSSPATNYSASSRPPPPTFASTPRTKEEPSPNQFSYQPAQLPPLPQGVQPRLGALEPYSGPAGPYNPFARKQ